MFEKTSDTMYFVFVGGLQRIQKANAEEFIHIFVNNSGKLTEFLEHMVEVRIYLVSLSITLHIM